MFKFCYFIAALLVLLKSLGFLSLLLCELNVLIRLCKNHISPDSINDYVRHIAELIQFRIVQPNTLSSLNHMTCFCCNKILDSEVVGLSFPAKHLTVASFLLLSADDLRELGFPLGPRKLLVKHLSSSQLANASSAVSVTAPSQQSNTISDLSADIVL